MQYCLQHNVGCSTTLCDFDECLSCLWYNDGRSLACEAPLGKICACEALIKAALTWEILAGAALPFKRMICFTLAWNEFAPLIPMLAERVCETLEGGENIMRRLKRQHFLAKGTSLWDIDEHSLDLWDAFRWSISFWDPDKRITGLWSADQCHSEKYGSLTVATLLVRHWRAKCMFLRHR